MNSLTMRKAIRGRSIEFTRLLILSMLEDANDTFSVTLSLLNSELGQCNLNADQFFQHFSRLLDELRTKVKNNKEEEDLLNSSSFLGFALPSSKKSKNDVIVLNDNNESVQSNNGFSISETGNIRPLFLNEQHSNVENGISQSSSKRLNQFLNQCNMCKKIVPSDQKFYFSVGLCSNCYQSELKKRQENNNDGITQSIIPTTSNALSNHRVCKRCRKSVSSQKALFKNYCSSCYYKTRRLNRTKPFSSNETEPTNNRSNFSSKSCLVDRQCSECAKIVPKTGIFYRSAQLCKNCYERQRVSIRKASQKQCSMCKKMTSGDILSGKCIPCYYQGIHYKSQKEPGSISSSSRKNSNELQIDSIDDPSNNQAINALLNLCPDLLNCHSCNKLVTQSDTDNNGNCRSCQTQSPASSVKIENDTEH